MLSSLLQRVSPSNVWFHVETLCGDFVEGIVLSIVALFDPLYRCATRERGDLALAEVFLSLFVCVFLHKWRQCSYTLVVSLNFLLLATKGGLIRFQVFFLTDHFFKLITKRPSSSLWAWYCFPAVC